MHLDLLDSLIRDEKRPIGTFLQLSLLREFGFTFFGGDLFGRFLAGDVFARDTVFVNTLLGLLGILRRDAVAEVDLAIFVDPAIEFALLRLGD